MKQHPKLKKAATFVVMRKTKKLRRGAYAAAFIGSRVYKRVARAR